MWLCASIENYFLTFLAFLSDVVVLVSRDQRDHLYLYYILPTPLSAIIDTSCIDDTIVISFIITTEGFTFAMKHNYSNWGGREWGDDIGIGGDSFQPMESSWNETKMWIFSSFELGYGRGVWGHVPPGKF